MLIHVSPRDSSGFRLSFDEHGFISLPLDDFSWASFPVFLSQKSSLSVLTSYNNSL
jgi:hypothetical protein